MRLTVAFDVDGTLIRLTADGRDVPNYDVIDQYRWFQAEGHHMVIWSGGGERYARQRAEQLGLVADLYCAKDPKVFAHITFDDEEVTLGEVNIQVGRGKVITHAASR